MRRQRSGRAVVTSSSLSRVPGPTVALFVTENTSVLWQVTRYSKGKHRSSCKLRARDSPATQYHQASHIRAICLGHGIDFCSVMGTQQQFRVQHLTQNELVVLCYVPSALIVPETTQEGVHFRQVAYSLWDSVPVYGLPVETALNLLKGAAVCKETRGVLCTSGTATSNF
jgi:hypothetical protein